LDSELPRQQITAEDSAVTCSNRDLEGVGAGRGRRGRLPI